MTTDQARIVFLEEALIQAYHTISFLHGCALGEVNGVKHSYQFPEQTQRRLDMITSLVTIPQGCFHSGPRKGCVHCEEKDTRWARREEARAVLGLKN